MNYATLDNILLDQDTLEAFEALARSRCVSPQVLARQIITDAVEPQPSRPDLDEFIPHRARRSLLDERRARRSRWMFDDPDDERDPLPMPADPDEEPASTRLIRRARSLPTL